MTNSDRTRLTQLRKTITYHAKKYHEENDPEISDEAYDSLLHEAIRLEEKLDGTRSSGVADGARASGAFAKVTHRVRQWSFDNVFSTKELFDWYSRLQRLLREADRIDDRIHFVVEHKIDGLKLILEYERGELVRCSTRGNGRIGEDVTHTAKTISSLPHRLNHDVDLVCVGEVWLGKKDFAALNQSQQARGGTMFANPRNAAAGSLRQLDAAVAANRNLSLTVYDIDYVDALETSLPTPQTQWEELQLLQTLGLPTSPHAKLCEDIESVQDAYDALVPVRDSFDFAIDGMVIKVNEIAQQRMFGYTAKGPRYGIAYKLPAEQTTTVVEAVTLQVGRTGVVTPVAELHPVTVAGTTVSRATLHNQDFITEKDIRIGDTVVIQKAGDIIPEVVEVVLGLRPASTQPYLFPKKVPGCGGDGTIERIPGEAAYRCVSLESDLLRKQRLYYLVSKQALDIDGVGPRIIDQLLDANLITAAEDLFTLTADQLEQLEGFKRKAAENVVTAIQAARSVELYRLLIGLSIDGVGEENAQLIADRMGSIEQVANATVEDVSAIHGLGTTVAQSLVDWFAVDSNTHQLANLLKHLTVINPTQTAAGLLNDQVFVLTGSLETLTRDEAKKAVRQAGGKVASAVSNKTSYVVAGSDPGSKAEKALAIGVPIISERDLLAMLRA